MSLNRGALADRQVELAKSEVARSWKIVLACIIALALPATDILGYFLNIRNFEQSRTNVTDANNQLYQKKLDLQALLPEARNSSEEEKTQINELIAEKRKASKDAKAATNLYDDARQDTMYVNFPIPGIETPIPVDARFAPLVWASLAFLTLLFMHISRRNIYRFLARSARIHIVELKHSESDLANHVFDLPRWLHPLPKRDGKCVPATTFSLFCGLHTSRGALLAPAGLVFLVVLAVLFMCYLSSWAAGRYVAELQNAGKSLELAHLVQAVSFVPFAAVLCVAFSWFSQQAVNDAFENETSHNNSRRQFAIWTVGLMAAIVAPPLFRDRTALASTFKRSLHLQERKPRFRKNEA